MLRRLGTLMAVLVLLSGCSSQRGNAEEGGKPTASPSAEVQATPSPAATSDPGGSSEPVASAAPVAYLDTAKLTSSFGFADGTGKHILATAENEGELERMKSLNTAVGNNGQTLAVKFEKWQHGTANSNGRDMANNFANLSGYVFTVQEGSALTDQTYYLADSAEFNLQSLLAVKPASGEQQLGADDPVRKDIAALKQRDIQSIWKLADLPEERQLYLVQFVRLDKDMLFSLALQEGTELSFMDYPAEIKDDAYSVWRVDDGGEVTPDMFSLLFAAKTASGLALGLEWWGAEGVNSFFLLQQGKSFKEMDIQYSRYTSPI
ncbi:hypothetical protein [Paenibacillus sp. BAC0078]